MSRLSFAPTLKEIKVTDIKKGIGVFTPKPDQPLSFLALKESLKKAGYTLDSANLRVQGTLVQDGELWFLDNPVSGQRFAIAGNAHEILSDLDANSQVELQGDWKTIGEGKNSQEQIRISDAKKVRVSEPARAGHLIEALDECSEVSFANAKYYESELFYGPAVKDVSEKPPAPIRVTSPGLTVYKGGAVTPRLYFIKQHLDNLSVNRQVLDVSLSYTPSPRVQLEVEVPISRTSFDDGTTADSATGLGNIVFWSKYRFFRKVKTYGDRQAAVRFGLELPTGKKEAPTLAEVNAPGFVRQQLTPISGGLSPHFDLAFSQAGGRVIFGGNAEAIVRSERDGFRLGHEIRLSTDTEYVLLPRQYDVPGGELFVILETTFVHRGQGSLNDTSVSGSNSTEYYVAPGLQYAAAPRFVIEGSFQFPVIRNTGPLVLRNDRNLLLGVRYLF